MENWNNGGLEWKIGMKNWNKVSKYRTRFEEKKNKKINLKKKMKWRIEIEQKWNRKKKYFEQNP